MVTKHIEKWDELEFVRNWSQTPVLQIDLRTGEVRNALTFRGNSVPIDVYNGLVLEFIIPKTADPTRVVSLLEEGAWDDLIKRILAGATVWWDGSNRRGRLDDDAAEAADELERTLDELHGTGEYTPWDPADWLGNDFSVNPDLTRDEIERLAAKLCDEALADGAYIELEEMIEYLEYLRDRNRN